jgi:hypothetical protein
MTSLGWRKAAMDSTPFRHRWRIVAALLMMLTVFAVSWVPIDAGAVTSAPAPHLTSNPSCATVPGGPRTGCIQAWSNGLTFSLSGTSYVRVGNLYDWGAVNGSSSSGGDVVTFCEGPNLSIFVPLTPGEYWGDEQVGSGIGGSSIAAHADLVVGVAGLPAAPPSLCNPVLPWAPSACTAGNSVAIVPTPSYYGLQPDQTDWIVTAQGQECGNGPYYGDASGLHLNKGVVGMAGTADGFGYWLLGGDGGVFSYGDAQFYGSTGNLQLNKPAIGMAATPDGKGYWFVASDGGVFSYGDAQFYGSMGGQHLNQPIVGMAADLATGGYWLVAADGGVFAFNAPFYGSTGSLRLNQPITGIEAARDGSGYRFVASDGGVFCFNQAFAGSQAGQQVMFPPIAGIASFGSSGYLLLESKYGRTYGFGGGPSF